MQEDTYRGDGLNLYAYCANNSVMHYDLSGHISLCLGGKTNSKSNDENNLNTNNFPDEVMLNQSYFGVQSIFKRKLKAWIN